MITEKFINRQAIGRLTINFDKGMSKNTESFMISKKEAHICLHDLDNIVSIFYVGKRVSIADIETWKK
jgi:hypothetical protein